MGEDQADLAAILGIVQLLKQMTPVNIRGRKTWNLSRAEVSDHFVRLVPSHDEIATTIDSEEDFLAKRGIAALPYIVAVGSSLKKITQYDVVVTKAVRYTFTTFRDALLSCFEIYWALDLKYPNHTSSVWHFLQTVIFNHKTVYDSIGTPVRELSVDVIFRDGTVRSVP